MTAQTDKGRQVAAPSPFAVAGRSESSPTGCSSGHSLRVDLRGGSYLPATLAVGLRYERTGSARAFATPVGDARRLGVANDHLLPASGCRRHIMIRKCKLETKERAEDEQGRGLRILEALRQA